MAPRIFRDRFPIGRLAEIEYLEPPPDTLFLQIVIILLYLLALACLVFFVWLGQIVALTENAVSQALGAQPANLASLRVSGLMLGLPPGLLGATLLFATGQALALFMRIERNTRRSTELLYYLLTEGRAGPPR